MTYHGINSYEQSNFFLKGNYLLSVCSTLPTLLLFWNECFHQEVNKMFIEVMDNIWNDKNQVRNLRNRLVSMGTHAQKLAHKDMHVNRMPCSRVWQHNPSLNRVMDEKKIIKINICLWVSVELITIPGMYKKCDHREVCEVHFLFCKMCLDRFTVLYETHFMFGWCTLNVLFLQVNCILKEHYVYNKCTLNVLLLSVIPFEQESGSTFHLHLFYIY